jgi:hypothetical protein
VQRQNHAERTFSHWQTATSKSTTFASSRHSFCINLSLTSLPALTEPNTVTMPDLAKDLEFLLAIVKTGSLTINYDAAATMLGWNKKKTTNKMSEFRKQAVSPNPPFFLRIFA